MIQVKDLEPEDQQIILQCILAVLNGRLIDSFEFQTRLGVDQSEVRAIVEQWPDVDDSVDESNVSLAINSCLNEISHGVTLSKAAQDKFGVSPRDAMRVFGHWSTGRWKQSR